MNNKTVLVIIGTRPEAIKLCPIILQLQQHPNITTHICTTGQHKDLVYPILDLFNIKPTIKLNLNINQPSLSLLTTTLIEKITNTLTLYKPDIILIHGDTTSAFTGALSSFYQKIPIVHIEAGLRTYDSMQPFPEEINRQMIDRIASLHFAPTSISYNNLIAEGFTDKTVYNTGNTIVDAVKYMINTYNITKQLTDKINILVTCHRRENWDSGIEHICNALLRIIQDNPNINIKLLTHPNPIVKNVIDAKLQNIDNITLYPALDYKETLEMMINTDIILTDSGGIQEEACTLNIPTLVLRNTSERPEGLNTGILQLVGTDENTIIQKTNELIHKHIPSNVSNITYNHIYGNGTAAEQITYVITNFLQLSV
jgi:UDP-N-acetylglucosamine 2-epimerase (non-hydrolysing)